MSTETDGEMIFPQGVPVRVYNNDNQLQSPPVEKPAASKQSVSSTESGAISTNAEAETIQEQARTACKPEDGENLLWQKEAPKGS